MSKQIKNFQLDYLNFTYFKNDSEDILQSFLDDFPEFSSHLDDMIILQGRNWGYKHVLAFTDFITIRYDDTCDKGVSVSITGSGLETFISWFNTVLHLEKPENRISRLFEMLKARGCRPSRIDLAYDDFSKKFTPKDYAVWFYNGCFNTRMLKHSVVCDGKKGYTFYIGNRRKKLIRIYDKNIESKGEIDAIRYEFELHGDYAVAMFDQIISEDVPLFGDLILDSFKIINRDSNERIDRCEMLDEWEQFVKSSLTQNYITVSHYKRSTSWEKLQKWLEKDVMPALKAYEVMFGKSWLLLELHKKELPDKYKRLLKDYGID